MSGEPLSDHEIQMLRGFLKGAGLGVPWMTSHAAEGLGISATTLMHSAPALRQLADRMSEILDLLSRGAVPESERDQIQREIGALKSHVDQAVSEINQAMQSVQSVVNALRSEHELLSVARNLEEDPDFGAFQ